MSTTTYTITNAISGAFLGAYSADSVRGALDAMARDAGYASHLDACMAAPVTDGELAVRAIGIPREALRLAEWAGVDVAADVRRLVSGEVTADALLVECLRGCESEHESDWRDYVSSLSAAVSS